ncbi:hypothetical protein AAKU55_002757 [Oxalobacteraceae bacterium GrIS 1.11]
MSQLPTFDPSIPVLTEVLEVPAFVDEAEELETLARKQWNEQEWQVLEQRLSERILGKLQGRVDFVLDQRVRDCMADVLQQTLEDLTNHIRSGLQQTIEEIVTRAVSQELTHLQTKK